MEPNVVSVRDREAFVAKHLPDLLGHDVKDFTVYTWRLTNWMILESKITSPEFTCGGHRWHVLLFPFGNSVASPREYVSVYLAHANPNQAPKDRHACAQFALAISNINDPTVHTVSHAQHRFTAEAPDWGFTRFSASDKLFKVQEGQRRPTVEQGTADVTVYVRVLDDPTGVLWENHDPNECRAKTGFVGLKNQGATGYVNCLLQSLFCMPSFIKAIYRIPTEHAIPTNSVPLALQLVFYRLQVSDQPVATTELTKSFGWEPNGSFYQHDVHEFKEILFHNLESKLRGTEVGRAIAKFFVGKMKSYIKCINVDYESSTLEEFRHIDLSVSGMKNVYESFRHFVAVEPMKGEYRYHAKGYGLQDAEQGVVFQSFPPVLHIRLKRFQYDIQRDKMVKINDRYEIPFEIDLGEFVDDGPAKFENWVYKLHGVLVHSGDERGGQYVALLKPGRYTRWLKFDDDRVTPMTDREVMEESFGGHDIKRLTNAYILIYFREIMMDELLAPVLEEEIPPHLKRGLDEERLQAEAKKREQEEQRLHLTAKVITDDTFSRHQGFDLATFDEKHGIPSDLPSFRVPGAETYTMFKSRLSRHFNLPENKVRLWVLANRQNKTVRPDTYIPENEPTLTVEVIRNNMGARQNDLRLYLDVIPNPSKPDLPVGAIMIFLKHFDASKQTLYGAGKVYVSRHAKVKDLCSTITERMKWPTECRLKLYEEIKPGLIELLRQQLTLGQNEITDGDVICFQVDPSAKEVKDLEDQGLYSDPIQFYNFLQKRSTKAPSV